MTSVGRSRRPRALPLIELGKKNSYDDKKLKIKTQIPCGVPQASILGPTPCQ